MNHTVKSAASAQSENSGVDATVIGGVKVAIEARLGKATLTIEELTALKSGATMALDTGLADSIDLFLNDRLIARGEIVAVGDHYGVRIADIVRE